MASFKASQQGSIKIRQVREQGWNRYDPRWLLAVSRILKPGVDFHEYGPFEISESTWGRFLDGKPIRTSVFKACCQVLGLDWEEVVDKDYAKHLVDSTSSNSYRCQDWGDAPDVRNFYGRTQELNTLNQWLVADSCRLVVLWGIGGIGKTALAVRCGEKVEEKFAGLIWRSLRNAPVLPELLGDIISHLSPRNSQNLPTSSHRLISQLLEILHQRRVLLILDGWENVLGGESAGIYRVGYENYGELLERIAEERHQSCLLLTSQEKPATVTELAGINVPVKLWQLQGLGTAAQEILQEYQLKYTPQQAKKLIQMYSGSPSGLRLISYDIQVLFDGSVSAYLSKNTIMMPVPLQNAIKQTLLRLSQLEEEILRCLARQTEAIDSDTLRTQISSQVSESEFLGKLSSLYQRSLIEKISTDDQACFTLQPMVRKCTIRFYSL